MPGSTLCYCRDWWSNNVLSLRFFLKINNCSKITRYVRVIISTIFDTLPQDSPEIFAKSPVAIAVRPIWLIRGTWACTHAAYLYAIYSIITVETIQKLSNSVQIWHELTIKYRLRRLYDIEWAKTSDTNAIILWITTCRPTNRIGSFRWSCAQVVECLLYSKSSHKYKHLMRSLEDATALSG